MIIFINFQNKYSSWKKNSFNSNVNAGISHIETSKMKK